MPRSNRPRNSKKRDEDAPLDLDRIRSGIKRTEVKNGIEYQVQPTAGTNADDGKTWICPHCNGVITKGIAHIVAWEAERSVDGRRHFHTNCWKQFQGRIL